MLKEQNNMEWRRRINRRKTGTARKNEGDPHSALLKGSPECHTQMNVIRWT